uniref:Uncharacterized protein n=1 Tax=Plectus sambesii TaxID=2011161 RepID=A0A914W5R5_9BILA
MTSKAPPIDLPSPGAPPRPGRVMSPAKNWLLRQTDSVARHRSLSPSPATLLRLARRVSASLSAELSRQQRPRTTRKSTSVSAEMAEEVPRCCNHGPGYASPKDAMHGPRETVIFVTCPRYNSDKPDMIATVDVDPTSNTYCT